MRDRMKRELEEALDRERLLDRVFELDTALMRPLFVFRMARAVLNAQVFARDEREVHSRSLTRSAQRRAENSAAEILDIVERWTRGESVRDESKTRRGGVGDSETHGDREAE